MILEILPVGPMLNRSYLIVCESTRKAALVDAAWDAGLLGRAVQKHGANLEWLLCTHEHFDHINAVAKLLKEYPDARAAFHRAEKISLPKDRVRRLEDGETIHVGEIGVTVLHTPGHTPGSAVFLAGGHAFFGDTLFSGETCGRVDFYKDGPKDMAASLQKIRDLPDSLIVCSGHKYGAYDTTTMKFEKDNNRALQCRSLEEFLKFKG